MKQKKPYVDQKTCRHPLIKGEDGIETCLICGAVLFDVLDLDPDPVPDFEDEYDEDEF